MRFAFTEEQVLFARTVRDVLARECPPAALREAARSDTGRSQERWRGLAEIGLVGLTVPEDHGGLGLDEIDLVLPLEECGYAALPEPVLETTAVAVPLLRDAGGAVAEEWLPRVAAGDAMLTVGHAANGLVPDAHVADLLLLHRGPDAHAVSRGDARIDSRPSLDPTRRLFAVDWEPRAETRMAAGEEGRSLLEGAFDRGALAAAAQAVGIGRRVIEMAAGYAKERQQFGRPVGSFQAVKHLLADAHLAVEFARPAVYRAAWSVARDVAERGRDVSMAKALASQAVVAACRAALQVHGAIGYTEEHDLHIWLKRGFALASAWGDADRHRERVRAALLGAS